MKRSMYHRIPNAPPSGKGRFISNCWDGWGRVFRKIVSKQLWTILMNKLNRIFILSEKGSGDRMLRFHIGRFERIYESV